MTVVEIYLAKADEWNERSKHATDADLRATYTALAITYRKIGTRLEELYAAASVATGETELQMAARHVAEQEARIVRQELLMARLEASGLPLDGASSLLETMHCVLGSMRARLTRISN
jgi:hypothetical protein